MSNFSSSFSAGGFGASASFGRVSKLMLMWEDKAGEPQFVRFDVVSAESYEALMSITSHPVERGADVTDHAREEPIVVTLEGFLSFTPLYQNPGVENLAGYSNKPLKPLYPPKLGGAPIFTPGGLASAVGGAIGDLLSPPKPPEANSLSFTTPEASRKRVIDLIDALQTARKSAARIRVIAGGGLHDLEDMMISRIGIPRVVEDSGGYLVQLELKQVRIASSEIVGAPAPAELRGQKAVSRGSQAGSPATPKQAEKAKSFAAAGFDSGKGTIGGITGVPVP